MKKTYSPILKKNITYFLVLLMLTQTLSCKYFKTQKIDSDFVATLSDIGEMNKYFLIHDGNDTYVLTNIAVDSTNVYGNLVAPIVQISYSDKRQGYRYHKEERNILNEVHFYLKKDAGKLGLGVGEIPLADIKEIRIIEKDTGKTVASYVFSAIGITAGVLVVAVIIILATKSSCPYVYVEDGEGFVFEGEIFGGAIAKNLEREDYMPLPSLRAKDGKYHLRISNELKERQYTDMAELIAVHHPKNQKVLLDKYGEPQLIGNEQTPIEATSINGINLFSSIEKKDKAVFLFNDSEKIKNGLTLKFKKPTDAKNGKLVFNGKNTMWFDYVFGEFLKKFGSSFDKWMNRQAKLPSAERLEKILENDFPLSVFIKKNGEWELVDYLHTVGPLADRDFVVPIDLSEIAGDEIEIKMETGFMFREIDCAAMDFSNNEKLKMTAIKPTVAFGTNSKNWTTALEKIDGNYMAQENIGEVTEIVYKAPTTLLHQTQTVFLHTRGYYELIREFEGFPKISALNKFKEAGYFSEFSRVGYLKTLEVEEEYFANLKSN